MTVSIQILQVPETESVRKREHFLSDPEFVIGRDYSADICLPDSSTKMSRKHLKVERLNTGSYAVTDLSTNGVKINGEKLEPQSPTLLSDGDVLDFCGYRMLLGIVGADKITAPEPGGTRVERFEPETDFNSGGPILKEAAIEEVAAPKTRDFGREPRDLEPDLLFDPFAEGPEMREPATIDPDPEPADYHLPERVEPGVFTTLARRSEASVALASAREAEMRARFYKAASTEAMERAFDRFLQEIDPETLQSDYETYMGFLSNRKKRYWQIHKRKFAKQRQSGELRRAFMAMFAEEMRRR